MNAISKFDGYSFQIFHEESTSNFRGYNQVFADRNNRIWAVSFDDQAFNRLLTIEGDKIIPVSDQFSELSAGIINIFFSRQGIIFITTPNGLYELKDLNTLERSILNDYAQLQGHVITPRAQEPEGGLILSSFEPNIPTQFFHKYRNGILAEMQVPDNSWFNAVNLIYKDSQGRTWFGNFGNGTAMYDPVQDRYHYFRQNNGLESDFISLITEDHEGNIWMGSRGKALQNTVVKALFHSILKTISMETWSGKFSRTRKEIYGSGLQLPGWSDMTVQTSRLFPSGIIPA